MPFNQGIFPTSVYGQLADTYGLPTYTATVGFPGPNGSGLVQGQGWLLFDFTMVNLLKAAASIAANAACMYQSGNSNFYTVIPAVTAGTNAVGTAPVTAVNDRGGALTTIGGYNWMTTYGLATALVAANQTATSAPTGVPIGASSTSGVLTSVGAAGTAYYNNVFLINTTTTAGAYPVLLQ
jgi:hypothetical protein